MRATRRHLLGAVALAVFTASALLMTRERTRAASAYVGGSTELDTPGWGSCAASAHRPADANAQWPANDAPLAPGTPVHTVYPHIPRTGGTTAQRAFVAWSKQAAWVPAATIGCCYGVPHADRDSTGWDAYIDATLRGISSSGHVPFGVHKTAWFRNGMAAAARPWQVVMLLRDPIERVVSQHFYVNGVYPTSRAVCNSPGKPSGLTLPTLRFGSKKKRMAAISLLEQVERGLLWNNMQYDWMHMHRGGGAVQVNRAGIDEAKRVMREELAVVGVTERLPEWLALVSLAGGYGVPEGLSSGQMRLGRPSVADVFAADPRLEPALRARTAADRELHEYALRLMDEQVECRRAANPRGWAALVDRMRAAVAVEKRCDDASCHDVTDLPALGTRASGVPSVALRHHWRAADESVCPAPTHGTPEYRMSPYERLRIETFAN